MHFTILLLSHMHDAVSYYGIFNSDVCEQESVADYKWTKNLKHQQSLIKSAIVLFSTSNERAVLFQNKLRRNVTR